MPFPRSRSQIIHHVQLKFEGRQNGLSVGALKSVVLLFWMVILPGASLAYHPIIKSTGYARRNAGVFVISSGVLAIRFDGVNLQVVSTGFILIRRKHPTIRAPGCPIWPMAGILFGS